MTAVSGRREASDCSAEDHIRGHLRFRDTRDGQREESRMCVSEFASLVQEAGREDEDVVLQIGEEGERHSRNFDRLVRLIGWSEGTDGDRRHDDGRKCRALLRLGLHVTGVRIKVIRRDGSFWQTAAFLAPATASATATSTASAKNTSTATAAATAATGTNVQKGSLSCGSGGNQE